MRQTKHHPVPLLKPNEQEFMRALSLLEKGQPPDKDAYGDVGDLSIALDSLIEAFDEDGLTGYQSAKKAILKNNRKLMKLVSTFAPSVEESEQGPDDETRVNYEDGSTGFKTFKIADLKSIPRVSWLIPGLLQKKALSLIYGDANTGKTFIALDMALCVAYGLDWQGRTIKEPGRVLYVYGEGNTGLYDRVNAWLTHHEQEPNDNIDFICNPVQLVGESEELYNTIEHLPSIPDMVIFDTFSMCASGINENDNTEVAKVIASASYIKRVYGSHVVIIHHVGKNGEYRGAAAFKGNVDTMIQMSNDDDSIMVECKKQRDKEKFDPFYLKLQSVDLGIDENSLESMSSLVVVSGEASHNSFKEQAQQEQAQLLILIADNPDLSENKLRQLANKELDIKERTFNNRLKFMIDKGILIKETGRPGKPTKYTIAPDHIPAPTPATDSEVEL